MTDLEPVAASVVGNVERAPTAAERLALSFLLGYSGNSRRAYANE